MESSWRVNARESNIELLRIVSMCMIIAFHITHHGFYNQLNNTNLITKFNSVSFNYPVFYKRLLIPEAIEPLGKIGNTVFFLISGYYLVDRGKAGRLRKTSWKLITQMIYMAVLLTVFSFVLTLASDYSFTRGEIKWFNSEWWFIGYYFLVITFGELYLNEFLREKSKIQYQTMLISCFALFSLGWSGQLLNKMGDGLRTVCAGVFCYAWGGYVRKFDPLKRIKTRYLLLFIGIIYLLVLISYYNATISRIEAYNRGDMNTAFTQLYQYSVYTDYSIVPIALGSILFEAFRRIKINGSCKIINRLAKGSLMVYLFHENDLYRNFWKEHDDMVNLLYESPFHFIGSLLMRIALTYIIGFCLYEAYTAISTGIARRAIKDHVAD